MRLIPLRFVLAAMYLAVAAPALAQHRVGTALDFQFDYAQVALDSAAVARFEVQVDGGAWTNTNLPVLPPGTYTYPLGVPAVGTHTVRVRACSATECSPGLSAASFSVIPLVPTDPLNPRVVPAAPPEPVSLAQAVDMAHAYSTLRQLRDFTDGELLWLVGEYGRSGNPTLTREGVLGFLDAAVVKLP